MGYRYLAAFKVFHYYTAALWGVDNGGRFVNDRTPANGSEQYGEELEELKGTLREHLDRVFVS